MSGAPKKWRCRVQVGRVVTDAYGETSMTKDAPVTAIVAPRATTDPLDSSDIATTTAVLYLDRGVAIAKGDRVFVLDGAQEGLVYTVDGDPQLWPVGTEVPLVRAV